MTNIVEATHFESYTGQALNKKARASIQALVESGEYGEYISVVRSDYGLRVAFAEKPGYVFSQYVLDEFESIDDLIWICNPEDSEHYYIAIKKDGICTVNEILGNSDSSPRVSAAISRIGEKYSPGVQIHGELPNALDQDLGDIRSSNWHVMEEDPRSSIQGRRYAARSIDQIEAEEEGKGLTVALPLIFILIVIGSAIFLMSGDGDEEKEEKVDPYQGYKDIMKQPTAASYLEELRNVSQSIQYIDGWNTVKCKAIDTLLKCELQLTKAASMHSLRNELSKTRRPVSIDMKASGATATITLQPKGVRSSYIIAPLSKARDLMIDRAQTIYLPDSISYKTRSTAGPWGKETYSIEKGRMQYDHLGLLAEATRNLPVTVTEAEIIPHTGRLRANITLTISGRI